MNQILSKERLARYGVFMWVAGFWVLPNDFVLRHV